MRPFALLGALVLLLSASTAQAQSSPVYRTLQAQATAIGIGTPIKTTGLRNKTFAIEISGVGSIHIECSIDNGITFDTIFDTTYTNTTIPECGPPPNRCLVDVPVSCTDVRAPITECSGCTISAKMMAEQ